MKIAVISDIHGNMQALESVLEDIKFQGCEKIYCLGDLVMAGAEPQKAVEFFMKAAQNPDFVIIQGNTDQYLGADSEAVYENIKKANEIMAEAYKADLNILTYEEKSFLRNLPPQKEIIIGALKILLVHGSPRANNENIFPSMPIEKIEEMIKETDADIIFCGHTHQPCGYQTNTRQTVVNDGSVGRPLNDVPKACYVVLEITNADEKEYNISHRLIDYDNETAAEILKSRDFKGADKLAAMLISAGERYPS